MHGNHISKWTSPHNENVLTSTNNVGIQKSQDLSEKSEFSVRLQGIQDENHLSQMNEIIVNFRASSNSLTHHKNDGQYFAISYFSCHHYLVAPCAGNRMSKRWKYIKSSYLCVHALRTHPIQMSVQMSIITFNRTQRERDTESAPHVKATYFMIFYIFSFS